MRVAIDAAPIRKSLRVCIVLSLRAPLRLRRVTPKRKGLASARHRDPPCTRCRQGETKSAALNQLDEAGKRIFARYTRLRDGSPTLHGSHAFDALQLRFPATEYVASPWPAVARTAKAARDGSGQQPSFHLDGKVDLTRQHDTTCSVVVNHIASVGSRESGAADLASLCGLPGDRCG
jgi:hypothetical protein